MAMAMALNNFHMFLRQIAWQVPLKRLEAIYTLVQNDTLPPRISMIPISSATLDCENLI